MSDNIERFNKYAAITFAKLYENFPSPVDLDARELATGLPQTENDDKAQARDLAGNDEVRFACDCLRWLMDNGYIKAPNPMDRNMTRIRRAVATPATLQALASEPDGKERLGDRIVTAIRKGALDGIRDASKSVVGNGLGMLVGLVLKS